MEIVKNHSDEGEAQKPGKCMAEETLEKGGNGVEVAIDKAYYKSAHPLRFVNPPTEKGPNKNRSERWGQCDRFRKALRVKENAWMPWRSRA